MRSHDISTQLDIVVHNVASYAPIFQDQAIAVVRPEAVRAIVEVKGALRREDVVDTVDAFADFAEKWDACAMDYPLYNNGLKLHEPGLFLMG